MYTFLILDGAGRVIRQASKAFAHKRYSARAAAQQKFLDSLYVSGATEGRIVKEGMDDLHFRFVKGQSMHYWPSKEALAKG